MSEEGTLLEGQTNTETPGEKSTETPVETTLLGAETPAEEGSETKMEEGEKPVEGEKTEEKKEEKAEVPEAYEDFSLPDGMTFDETTLGKFKEVAKTMSLTQENAQEMVALAVDHLQSVKAQEAQAWMDQRKEWVSDIQKDVDFGKGNFKETLERANRALRKFGEDSFVSFINESGFGDHPGLVKLLARVDQSMSEDTIVEGKAGTTEKRGHAETLYPPEKK